MSTAVPSSLHADVLVVGGGLGGVAAALGALESGKSVVMSEQYEWLGGQLTSQAVPSDEHAWVEQFGITARYRQLREGIRAYYRRNYPLTAEARAAIALNPGAGHVSQLCSEPRAAVAVIDEMLAPFRATGRLTILQPAIAQSAEVVADSVKSVTFLTRGLTVEVSASFVVDATETGELLPLVGAEYVSGTESREMTGEPHAPLAGREANVQALSWCFAIDHTDGDNRIVPPASYEYWRSYAPRFWGGPLLSLEGPNPRTLANATRTFTPNPGDDPLTVNANQRDSAGDEELWTFRRILSKDLFAAGHFPSDIVLVNWPMIDYLEGSIIDVSPAEAADHLERARELSLSMFYWLQTEAPRADGGKGWPGLRLRGDITGTTDGLAQAPYIRESRRIVAEFTIREQDLSVDSRGDNSPATFFDSVGVGMYRIDLHPTTGGDNYLDIPSVPFEIPLGALLPIRLQNLLPAAKNVGTTHITNGAFRLHPVEWNIGEVAGRLAAFCLDRASEPRAVRNSPSLLSDFQSLLTTSGVELHWPDISGY